MTWACIALTCSDHNWAQALREELTILKKQHVLSSSLQYLVLEDPPGTVGSGGATINALLVIVERLCNLQGFTTVTTDVLKDSHILIIHHGRSSCMWPNGKALFPCWEKSCNNAGLATHLERIILLCDQLKTFGPPGVWVASTDFLLCSMEVNSYDWSGFRSDALMLTLTTHKKAKNCATVKVDKESIIQQIVYNENDSENMEIPGGVVFLKAPVAESLVSLYSSPPLDCCTYLGIDNGETPLQISLYFDILGPLYKGIGKDLFLSESFSDAYCKAFGLLNKEQPLMRKARNILWESLHNYSIAAYNIGATNHFYWSDNASMEDIYLSSGLFEDWNKGPKVLHSFVLGCQEKPNILCINSSITVDLEPEKELIAISSKILASNNRSLRFPGRSYIVNVNINLDEIPDFHLNDDAVIIGYWINVENEIKMAASLFSAKDVPILEITNEKATIFGLKWDEYLAIKGINSEDLWDKGERRSLFTAKLYPIPENITCWRNILWLQDVLGNLSYPNRLNSWRKTKRYSIEDFKRLFQPEKSFQNLRAINTLVIIQGLSNWKSSFHPYLRKACAENWAKDLLEAFDRSALTCNSVTEASRMLSGIADLLGCMAGDEGGLRSGPASNQNWSIPFDLLENMSLEEGIIALARERHRWVDTPERLVRAARHYEKAVHILIRKTVKSVRNKITHQYMGVQRPELGVWIEAECPARIDLSGGWSDTPPICYEMGGSVVNLAILVDGKKPIGAKGRRIPELQLVLVLEDNSEPLLLTTVDEVLNYTNPTARGALLKAAFVCAEVVQHDSNLSLQQQLQRTFGSGLELQCWSLLPQGSGLGTSSILAAALLAVIYSAMGVSFDRSKLIHAVLYIEQLLTTGGGWQDQIGGVMGKCNLGKSPANPNVEVMVHPLELPEHTVQLINNHLLLLHTGKVRLARNLLQNVIRQWYARDEGIIHCFEELVTNALKCADAVRKGDLTLLGETINIYWTQKKIIAPGCEPLLVGQLMRQLNSYVDGQCLAGAGGGGFYFGILKEPGNLNKIQKIVSNIEGGDKIIFHSAAVDQSGITLKVNGLTKIIP